MVKLRFTVDEAGGSTESVGDFGGGRILDVIQISLIAPCFIHNFNNYFRIMRMNKSNF